MNLRSFKNLFLPLALLALAAGPCLAEEDLQEDEKTEEEIEGVYKNAIKLLEQIQKGIVSLGIETQGTATELGEYRTNKTYQDRIFTKNLLDTF